MKDLYTQGVAIHGVPRVDALATLEGAAKHSQRNMPASLRAAKRGVRDAVAAVKAERNVFSGAVASRRPTLRGLRSFGTTEPPCARTERARSCPSH
ncbi:hypothetical protein [Ferrimicrobium acidiphilum]|uniref:hypothetical protein n=1 Tax=Ferrimicrobium acidiphilum TaxID=121039 RepID=UPI0023F28623|nr:hypothetical protein [Ferrimicrobium acidiphilum]